MNAALLALAFVVQDTVVLKPVVVTATRFPVVVDVVASAVTVIGGAELRAQGVRSVAEALRHVPGVAVVETGSFGGQTSLFLRGGESDYVKVLLDGVPLNQAGGGLDLAGLTTDNVDRIEIVRGPGSVLYGSDAMTGVIQIFTRTGQGAPRVGAELRAGTYGTTDGAVEVSGGGPGVSYSMRASRFGSDGLYPRNNQYRNAVVSARVRVAPDARTDASLAYRYGDDVYHVPTNSAGQPADSNAFTTERGPAISLAVGRTLGTRLEARVLATLREGRLAFGDEADSPGEDGSFWSRDYVRRAGAGAMTTW
ncbi:MAG: TonB-dependent receptor, partial [Candidatus Rokuibacteriota bacterium]